MLRSIALVAVAALFVASPASAQRGQSSTDRTPTQVRDRVVELDAIVADLVRRLEAAEVTISILQAEILRLQPAVVRESVVSAEDAATLPVVSEPDNIAQVILITLLPPDEAKLEEVQAIQEGIEDREKAIRDIERRNTGDSRSRARLNSQITSIRVDIRRMQGQITRLEREAAEPRHVITAWDGSRDVLIYTTRDESRVITELSVGAFVQWTGTRIEAGTTVCRWEARGISVGSAPTRFRSRPATPLPRL